MAVNQSQRLFMLPMRAMSANTATVDFTSPFRAKGKPTQYGQAKHQFGGIKYNKGAAIGLQSEAIENKKYLDNLKKL